MTKDWTDLLIHSLTHSLTHRTSDKATCKPAFRGNKHRLAKHGEIHVKGTLPSNSDHWPIRGQDNLCSPSIG